MFRYQNNAFRVLGLLPDATLSQVRQRADEIKVKNDLGLEIFFEYDFPLLGELDRSYENVIAAVERLENPLLRLKEEIFYFWIDNKADKDGIELLRESRIKELIQLWTVKRLDRKNISTAVNRVVLAHGIAISNEIKGDFSDENWTNWEIAIKSFVEFSQSDLYWARIKERIKKFKDKRAERIDLINIKENYLDNIIKVNFMFISQSSATRNYERIGKHISLLKELKASSRNFKKHIDNVLKYTIDKILYHTKRARDWLNQDGENASLQELIDVGKKYKSGIQNFIDEGKCVDTEGISSFSIALDKSAQLLREFAVIIHNGCCKKAEYSYDIREGGYKIVTGDLEIEAHELMNYAYKIVHSPYLKDKFRSDLEILQEFCDLYKSQTQEKRRSSLWSIIKWGFWIFVSIVILRPCFKDLSEETKKDTFKYTVQSGDTLSKIAKQYNVSIHDIATANKLYNINQLRVGQELTIPQTQTSTITERKVHLEEQIKDRKNKIKGWESYLTLLRTEAENLKNEIDDLNSEYSNSYYVPQYIIDDYNEKVEKYNAIVKKYESNYVVYKKEFDEYNEMVRQYNNMLK